MSGIENSYDIGLKTLALLGFSIILTTSSSSSSKWSKRPFSKLKKKRYFEIQNKTSNNLLLICLRMCLTKAWRLTGTQSTSCRLTSRWRLLAAIQGTFGTKLKFNWRLAFKLNLYKWPLITHLVCCRSREIIICRRKTKTQGKHKSKIVQYYKL